MIVEAQIEREVGEVDLAADQSPASVRIGATQHQGVQGGSVDAWRYQSWRPPVKAPRRQTRELTEGRGVLAGDDMKRLAGRRRRGRKRENRVGDVIDADDVEDGVTSAREHEVRSTCERSQRTVDDVERCCPASPALADDDARTHDRDRQPRAPAHTISPRVWTAHTRCGPLPDVELCLPRAAVSVARDISGRHVCDPPQALAAGGAILRQVEDSAGPLDVDRPRLRQRQVKRDPSRAMDDIADLLRDPIAVGAETKTGRGQIATDGRDPPPMPLGSVE